MLTRDQPVPPSVKKPSIFAAQWVSALHIPHLVKFCPISYFRLSPGKKGHHETLSGFEPMFWWVSPLRTGGHNKTRETMKQTNAQAPAVTTVAGHNQLPLMVFFFLSFFSFFCRHFFVLCKGRSIAGYYTYPQTFHSIQP